MGFVLGNGTSWYSGGSGKSYCFRISSTCFFFSGYISHSMYPFHPSRSSSKWGISPFGRNGIAFGSAGAMMWLDKFPMANGIGERKDTGCLWEGSWSNMIPLFPYTPTNINSDAFDRIVRIAFGILWTSNGRIWILLDSRVVFWPSGQLTSRLGKYRIPQYPQHLLDRLVPQNSSLINLIYIIIPI